MTIQADGIEQEEEEKEKKKERKLPFGLLPGKLKEI